MTNKDDDLTEHELFMQAMQDVVPLKSTGQTLNKTSSHPKKLLKFKEPLEEPSITLSDHCAVDILPEQHLTFVKPGVQPHYFRQLKQGKIAIEAELDLHGYSIEKARSALVEFIDLAITHHYRCVRIIHGKGYRGQSKIPLLKSKTYTWLMQLPNILAFSSCQPKHGGTGALYILLKR